MTETGFYQQTDRETDKYRDNAGIEREMTKLYRKQKESKFAPGLKPDSDERKCVRTSASPRKISTFF